jgi:hypothetical protein
MVTETRAKNLPVPGDGDDKDCNGEASLNNFILYGRAR